jgi:hypothetical protein
VSATFFEADEANFRLAAHAVTVCKLARVAAVGSLTHDEAFETYYKTFGEQLDLHGFPSLWDLCESVPDLLTVSFGTLGLSDGGRYFNALAVDHPVVMIREVRKAPTSSSSTASSGKGRKPRLAAAFRTPMGSD